jgi:small-conductance mechanosensitive channel
MGRAGGGRGGHRRLAWLLARSACAHYRASAHWKFGRGEFNRVVFPFFAIVLVGIARLVMDRLGQPVRLLEITSALLVALLLIRIAVYILGHVLPSGPALRLTVRVIAWIAWIGVALHITGLLPDVLQALDDVGFTLGKQQSRITLLVVLQALAAMAVTLTVALWLARVTGGRVLAAKSVEMSTRVVVVKIINTGGPRRRGDGGAAAGGNRHHGAVGIRGALGVGLGFGLQKVAASYVSGFIVLLERSLRIGDVITVENRRGVVESIESRYTVIKAGDGTETILPNEVLITKEVVHHTYTDPKVALVVPMTVTYGTDADRACELLAEIGKRNMRVIGDPAPLARVTALNERGIQLELTVWISDPEKGDSDLRSDLLKEVLRAFRDEKIELAYNRAEMRLIATPEMAEKHVKTVT